MFSLISYWYVWKKAEKQKTLDIQCGGVLVCKQGECERPELKQLKLESVQDQMNHDPGFLSICWVVIWVMILSDILFLFLTSIAFTTFCPYQLSHSCPSSQSASSVPPQVARLPLLFQNLTFPSIPYVPWFEFFPSTFLCIKSCLFFKYLLLSWFLLVDILRLHLGALLLWFVIFPHADT